MDAELAQGSEPAIVAGVRRIRPLSVISSIRRLRRQAGLVEDRRTVATMSCSRNWRAERLTLIRRSGRSSGSASRAPGGTPRGGSSGRSGRCRRSPRRGRSTRRASGPRLGRLPADERLEPDDPAGAELDDRLVVEAELVALLDAAEARRAGRSLGRALARAGRKISAPPRGRLLRRVHRDVGVAQQVVGGLVAAPPEGDADARRDPDQRGVDDRRLADVPSLGVIAVSLSIVTLIYAPLAATSLPDEAPSINALLAVLGLSLICTGLAFVVFFGLIDEVGPPHAGLITFANPVVAVALGTVFLDEALTVATGIGFVLVIAGCWLATRPPPEQVDHPADAPVLDAAAGGLEHRSA